MPTPNVIPTNSLIQWLDGCTAAYLLARGSDPTISTSPSNPNGFGMGIIGGDWGCTNNNNALFDALITAGADAGGAGLNAVAALAQVAQNFQNNQGVQFYASQVLSQPLVAVQQQIASANAGSSIYTIDGYLQQLNCTNGVTFWQALMPPAFGLMWQDCFGGAQKIGQYNMWQEVLQSTLYAYALGGLAVSGNVFTAGFDISSAGLYAGGFPYVNVTAVTGTGVITVTGTAYNPASVGTSTSPLVTGATWQYNLTSAVTGEYALAPGGSSPAPANSLIMKVTGISVAAGISAGQLYVESHRPLSRANFNY